MKVLGATQFHQKTFKLMEIIDEEFKGLLGDVPLHFTALVKGYSGNGKTELCMKLAKFLNSYGKVLWLSYEQRHGYDLQKATIRNNMANNPNSFLVADPLEGLDAGVSLLEDLDRVLKKRGSADYIFFDSIDYTGFTWKDYEYIKNKYAHKKGLIFISHSTKSGAFKKRISEQIGFDGGMIFHVDKFICYPEKNRFGGFTPYVIFEERARLLNPLFFDKQLKESKATKGSKTVPNPQQLTIESPEAMAENDPEKSEVVTNKATQK